MNVVATNTIMARYIQTYIRLVYQPVYMLLSYWGLQEELDREPPTTTYIIY